MTDHLCLDVRCEDGLVFQPAGKNLKIIWVRCPTCGPQPPLTAWNEARATYAAVSHAESVPYGQQRPLACSVCGQDAPWKYVFIPKNRKQSPSRCTRRCTDGKSFCACGCRGRCHGEHRCYCDESPKGERV